MADTTKTYTLPFTAQEIENLLKRVQSGGNTNFIFRDSVEDLPDPATVPKGTIALVPSEDEGGSGLPPVTEADNGKVLVAQDGKWIIKEFKEANTGVVSVNYNDSGDIDLAEYPVGTLFVLYRG